MSQDINNLNFNPYSQKSSFTGDINKDPITGDEKWGAGVGEENLTQNDWMKNTGDSGPGAWEGFKKGMASKWGEKAAHGLSDVALGASEGKVNEATGYMSTGSVGSAMAKGAISGAIGSGGNPFAAMAGAGIAGITASLQNKQIRKRNRQLKLSRDATIKSDTEMSKASLAGKTGERKAAAMRGLGQTMSQALLG